MASKKVASEQDYECYLQNTLGISIWLVQVYLLERKNTHLLYNINQCSFPRYEVAESDTCAKFWLQWNREAEPLTSVAIRKLFLTAWLTSSGASASGTQASFKSFKSRYANTKHLWSLFREKKVVKIFLLGHLSFHQSWFSGYMIRKFKENTFRKITFWKGNKGNGSFSHLCMCVKVLTC